MSTVRKALMTAVVAAAGPPSTVAASRLKPDAEAAQALSKEEELERLRALGYGQ